jgi:hypothetical protein
MGLTHSSIGRIPGCNRRGNILCQHIKIWADRYPFIAEIKGASLSLETGRCLFVVTSNWNIDEGFSRDRDIQPVKRRFHVTEITPENEVFLRDMRLMTEMLHRDGSVEDAVVSEEEKELLRWNEKEPLVERPP